MNEEIAEILDACLTALAAGESLAACLARYPEQAADLAPMLAAAQELAALAELGLPPEQWTRVAAGLASSATMQTSWGMTREPSVQQPARSADARQSGPPDATSRGLAPLVAHFWPRPRHAPVRRAAKVAAVVVALLLVVSASATAASHPGDVTYGWRLAAERVPVYLAVTPLGRGATQLRYADRRLTDVRTHMIAAGHADHTALAALLESDADAARLAEGLPAAQREQIAAWILSHGACLQELSRSSRSERASIDLAGVAGRVLQLAAQARGGAAPDADAAGAAPCAPR